MEKTNWLEYDADEMVKGDKQYLWHHLKPHKVFEKQEQMVVVINQVLPRELKVRGVEDPEGVCGDLSQAVKGFEAGNDESAGASPEDVFRRLSRS